MSQNPVQRTTMFKVSNPDDISKLIDLYRELASNAKKDGKPYVLSLQAGPTNPSDPRSNGFTFAAVSHFATMEDMKYYDNECVAHQELKKAIKPVIQGAMTVYFQDAL